MSDKKQIKISEILELLQQGKKRSQIAEYYDITDADVKKIFMHPLLKGKKAHKEPSWTLVDDSVAEVEAPTNVNAEEVPDETPNAEVIQDTEY